MNKKLYVGNLAYSVSSRELNEFLSAKWEIADCKVIEGKGFGFVTFADSESANAAKEELNGTEYQGRKLQIDNARENTERSSSGGGGRGGYGGGGGGGGYGGGQKRRY